MLDNDGKRYVTKDKIIDLTNSETIVLDYLIWNKHRVVKTDELAHLLYDDKPYVRYDDAIKNVYQVMFKANHKLEGVLYIKNKRSMGYIIGGTNEEIRDNDSICARRAKRNYRKGIGLYRKNHKNYSK